MNTNLSSKDILELAISKHKTQDLSGAEKLYQEVLNKDDNNFNANFLLGTLFASTKRFELALTKLE
jgi:cytochrome c-type biogenesis protein CcmH/NrfG